MGEIIATEKVPAINRPRLELSTERQAVPPRRETMIQREREMTSSSKRADLLQVQRDEIILSM